MHISYQCPECGHANQSPELEAGTILRCHACDWTHSPDGSIDSAGSGQSIRMHPTRCLVCSNCDLWRQKDFPPALGLALVALGAVLSSIAWYFHWPKTALGILMAFALADMLVFAVMPDVLVCYRCRARHHRARPPADHPGFNHELAERYRQEQLHLRDSARTGAA